MFFKRFCLLLITGILLINNDFSVINETDNVGMIAGDDYENVLGKDLTTDTIFSLYTVDFNRSHDLVTL